ncbi:MAG: methyltransferase domain-containing protein [Beutenbergiaceae bacterium]
MHCDYYHGGTCRSCTLLPVPYQQQLRRKQDQVAAQLPSLPWEPAVPSAESGFRNKAKMVAAGSVQAPTLGILDHAGSGIDLVNCPLHEPAILAALPVLRDFITVATLTPYSVPERRGELKAVLVTGTPDGSLMIRFVLRSSEALPRLRKHLPALQAALPNAHVISANVQPVHAAVLEGETEVALTPQQHLQLPVNGIELHLLPGSFFQTNTAVAAALYRTAANWADEDARTVLDLYCGVGAFALHLVRPGRQVRGVEISAAAVAAAQAGAAQMGAPARFEVADATQHHLDRDIDLVVVNPPRRGLTGLAAQLEASTARSVLYSSCNPRTLAQDLAAMPALVAERAQLFDMFPHNQHAEVLVLLRRR